MTCMCSVALVVDIGLLGVPSTLTSRLAHRFVVTLFRMTRPSTARVSCGPCWPSLYCSRLCEHTTHSLTLSYGIALTLPLQHTMASCRIQWLYLAVHGCKTYLNLNYSDT
jgi:hypothetical protein